MISLSKPAPIEPSGQPECALSEAHWANRWTVGDCVTRLDDVPTVLRLLEPATVLADIWHHLTLGTKLALEGAFVVYDVRTGRI